MKMKEKNDTCQDIVYRLILQVREGDQHAFGELLKLYDPLFLSLLAKTEMSGLNQQDIEDLRQELTVVFYHSILSYELEQTDVKFGLYAKICMRNALITQMRKRKARQASLSLEEDKEEGRIELLEGGEDPTKEFLSRETVESMNQKIREVLSPFEAKVWQMYLTGNGSQSIADALGKSEKSIENALFRLRHKLRDIFGSDI